MALGKVTLGKRSADGLVEKVRTRRPRAASVHPGVSAGEVPSEEISIQPGEMTAPPATDVSEPPTGPTLMSVPPRAPGTARRQRAATPRPTAPRERRTGGAAPWIVAFGVVAAAGVGAYLTLRREEPARWSMPDEVTGRMALGRPDDLAFAENELSRVRPELPGAEAALAGLAEERALALVEYREGDAGRVRAAIAAAEDTDPLGAQAATLAIARAALLVAELGTRPEREALAAARAEVQRAVVTSRRDARALWLDGELAMLAGDRAAASRALSEADARGAGPVRAQLALAELALDGGETERALDGFTAALARAPSHPRALIGAAMARAEMRVPGDAKLLASLDDAERQLRGAARADVDLARAAVTARVDPAASSAALDRVGDHVPRRELLWVALLRADRGELGEAGRVRSLASGGGDPLLAAAIDAELALARGIPEDALALLPGRGDLRARVTRARALLDLGRFEDARVDLEAAQRVVAGDPRIAALAALARVRSGDDADAALASLDAAAASGDRFAALLLGEAQLGRGDAAGAARWLEAARGDHPAAYRARVRLAALALAAYAAERGGKAVDAAAGLRALDGVEDDLRAALEQAPEYLPARALLGRYLVAVGRNAAALAAFMPVASAGRAVADDELAMAVAHAAGGDRERTRDALRRALAKGASPDAARAVALRIDKALVAELGL